MSNLFWKELLQTWVYCLDNRLTDIPKEHMLPNTNIWSSGLIQNQNLLGRKNYFMSKGLIYLYDMFDNTSHNIKTRQMLLDQYNISISHFDFICLSQSIPRRHKDRILNYVPPIERPTFGILVSDICHKVKLCRYMYCKIIEKLPFDIKSLPKWEHSVRRNFDNLHWSNIFTLPKRVTLDSQLRVFQYKIIHRVLPTNDLLHKYQIRDNPYCDLCENIIENIEHTFHLCPKKLKLWYDLADWLLPNVDLFPFINTEHILLGIFDEIRPIENTIILAIKRYIYINKCKETAISFIGALHYLKNIMNIETHITELLIQEKNIEKWAQLKSKFDTL